MRQTQKNILWAFMQFPRTSDRGIARRIGVSQPTVTRCRHRLVERGFLSFLAVPGLDKLGYEIVAMNTIVIRSDKDRTALEDDKRVVFAVEMDYKTAFVVSVHKNYGSYAEFIGKYSYKIATLSLTSKLNKPIKPFSFKDIP